MFLTHFNEQHIIPRLFPELKDYNWGYLNLNDIAIQLMPLLMPLMDQPTNPFLSPTYCDLWKNFIHYLKGYDYSWGGYMEDRAIVWAGHYQEEGATMHVGVDFYVPTDTLVHLPVDGRLVYSSVDPDQEGGWGGRVIFDLGEEHLILAHLKDMSKEIGRVYLKGQPVARIAEPAVNGGWSPHLHVQRVKSKDLDHVLSVDGYIKPYEGIKNDFPNPVEL
ncbi:MAG: hypothetical protein ACREGR_03545 [Minisyncoccia bacterium]